MLSDIFCCKINLHYWNVVMHCLLVDLGFYPFQVDKISLCILFCKSCRRYSLSHNWFKVTNNQKKLFLWVAKSSGWVEAHFLGWVVGVGSVFLFIMTAVSWCVPPSHLLSNFNRLLPPPLPTDICSIDSTDIFYANEWWGGGWGGGILPSFLSWRNGGLPGNIFVAAIFMR